ncbi:THC0290_0291 family protein [Aestuariibaculum lutulentum]|uniref:Glutamate dehydrogenase n=2 Tax=Aestuariibaculum lutulentum TaxID=2920935 RepID=A0ABS9RG92_9FLAO|nr:glutamate dehydrogenase [Aestuariibaculum lutulentum]MCH4551963.1 glutamate dehydrogenase [Aestuariibaculum lutulentum]
MLNFKCLALLFFMFVTTQTMFSQLGFSHEIGAIIGPVEFRSDFGSRNEEATNLGNSGIGIGLIHYISFAYTADCNCYSTDTYFNDHFKLRSEISYNYTRLDHHGFWVAPDKTSTAADKLRAHSGAAENFDIGMQLEYFPLSIRSFQAFAYRVAPFVSLGVHYTSYHPKASTRYNNPNPDAYGDIYDQSNLYPYWFDAYNAGEAPYPINIDGGSTWSVVSSIGARYKLGILSDLMIDLRWQYYFSDWIDGFDHNWRNYDRKNDWLVWLNFGYVYYLD